MSASLQGGLTSSCYNPGTALLPHQHGVQAQRLLGHICLHSVPQALGARPDEQPNAPELLPAPTDNRVHSHSTNTHLAGDAEQPTRLTLSTRKLHPPDRQPVGILLIRLLVHTVGLPLPVVVAAQQLAVGVQISVEEGRQRPSQGNQLAGLQSNMASVWGATSRDPGKCSSSGGGYRSGKRHRTC